MAEKKVTYIEPASYFTPSMLKVAREWEEKHEKSEEDKKQTAKGEAEKKK